MTLSRGECLDLPSLLLRPSEKETTWFNIQIIYNVNVRAQMIATNDFLRRHLNFRGETVSISVRVDYVNVFNYLTRHI